MTLDQLINAYKAVHDGVAPDTATQARLQYFVNLSDHQPSDAAAMSYIVNTADNTTALAALSYQFFTGKSPTKAGLDYLVNSPANPTDLNDGYYSGFNIENRYINFAANLGVQGEGAATFANKYAALSFADYVASIYQTIIGSSYATAAGIDPAKAIADIVARKDAILATAQGSGMITPNMTAAQVDLALKAATAGYLLGEAIKADVGVYASAANNFMVAVATGTATYGTDITTTYAKPAGVLGAGGGQAVSPGFNFPAPTPPVDNTPPTTTPAPVAHAFTLTVGADTVTGESLADTFTGTIGAGATFSPADVLNGGGGSDTLVLNSTAGSFTFDPAKIISIETLQVNAQTQVLNVDLAGAGFTEVVNTGSSQPMAFHNALATTGLSISNTSALTVFDTPNAGLTGSSDAITLKLDTVTGAASVTITTGAPVANEFETLNIVSNGGANSITLSTDGAQTSLATINVSGSANLTLAFATAGGDQTSTTVTTIDAHALTGNLTVSGAATIANTIIGGSGNDVITLGALGANAVSGADVITTNGGSDVVRFVGNIAAGTGASTALTAFAKITDFNVASDKVAFSADNADFSLTPAGGTAKLGLSKGTGLQSLAGGDTMVLQTLAQNEAAAGPTTDASFVKLTQGVAFHTDIKTTFADAIGTGSILHFANNGNYLVSVYDTTHQQMIVAVVNVGGNADGDDNLFANDFTDTAVAVVGVIDMTAGNYAAFGAGNLGLAF
jgi:S-layer protein